MKQLMLAAVTYGSSKGDSWMGEMSSIKSDSRLGDVQCAAGNVILGPVRRFKILVPELGISSLN